MTLFQRQSYFSFSYHLVSVTDLDKQPQFTQPSEAQMAREATTFIDLNLGLLNKTRGWAQNSEQNRCEDLIPPQAFFTHWSQTLKREESIARWLVSRWVTGKWVGLAPLTHMALSLLNQTRGSNQTAPLCCAYSSSASATCAPACAASIAKCTRTGEEHFKGLNANWEEKV